MQEINLHIHHNQSACENHDLEDHLKAKACKEEVRTLIELWLVAGELQIFKLQNRAMGCLLKVARKCASTFGVFYVRVYAKTRAGSPLREFVVRLSAWNEDFHEFETRPHLFPPAMLRDLATTYRKALPEVVAAAKRREMQRNHSELMVKETLTDPGRTPQQHRKVQSWLTKLDATKEMGLDEMLHKYPRRELSLDAVGWSMPAGFQQTDLKAWEEIITRRSPSKATRASTAAAESNPPDEDLLGLWDSPSKEDKHVKKEKVEENIAIPKPTFRELVQGLDHMETEANTWEFDETLPAVTPQAIDLNEPKTSHWEFDTLASVPASPAVVHVKHERDSYSTGGWELSLKKTQQDRGNDKDRGEPTPRATLFPTPGGGSGLLVDLTPNDNSRTYVDVPAPVGLLIDIDQPDGWTNIVTSKVHDVIEAERKTSGETRFASDKSLGKLVMASEKAKDIVVKSTAPVSPALHSAKPPGNCLSSSEKENREMDIKSAAPVSPALNSAKSAKERILGNWLSASEKQKKISEITPAKLTPQAMHFSEPVDDKWMEFWGPHGKNFQKQVDAALDLPIATTPALPAAMDTPMFESEGDLLGLATSMEECLCMLICVCKHKL
ncbi:hypothetical protein BDZ45DRAFT_695893 [Acephala macrosclerotiorum]|nr:hypothetical protein BDZ45DRAFT_695893 [Acephala macrosclerotiorum]